MYKVNSIKDMIYNEIKAYSNSNNNIDNKNKLYSDLGIYGDDLEDMIYTLSQDLNFDVYMFWELFIKKNYYSPSEVDISYIPKIFFLDIGSLLKGKIKYNKPNSNFNGKDITVSEIIDLIETILST